MANIFDTVIKGRTPRYRTLPLIQTPRRGEVRSTPTVLPVGDPRRDTWYPPVGNELTSWVSLGNDGFELPKSTSRHAWPFVPPPRDPYEHRAGNLDHALNAENLISQIVPSSAGRGLLYPKRAGYDLIARIYSAKRWRISGTLQGQTIDETWGPRTTFNVAVDNGVVSSRYETPYGEGSGRQMSPIGLSVNMSQIPDSGATGPDIRVALELTAPSAQSFGEEGWASRFSYLGAGLDDAGNPVIHPFIEGRFFVDERRHIRPYPSVAEPIAYSLGIFSSDRLFGFYGGTEERLLDVELSPITFCGYQLMANVLPDSYGSISGSLNVDVAETWGPGEWPL